MPKHYYLPRLPVNKSQWDKWDWMDRGIPCARGINTTKALISAIGLMYGDNEIFRSKCLCGTMCSSNSLPFIRVRLFGPDSDSDARGMLHMAFNDTFDRWANSRAVDVDLDTLIGRIGIKSTQYLVHNLTNAMMASAVLMRIRGEGVKSINVGSSSALDRKE